MIQPSRCDSESRADEMTSVSTPSRHDSTARFAGISGILRTARSGTSSLSARTAEAKERTAIAVRHVSRILAPSAFPLAQKKRGERPSGFYHHRGKSAMARNRGSARRQFRAVDGGTYQAYRSGPADENSRRSLSQETNLCANATSLPVPVAPIRLAGEVFSKATERRPPPACRLPLWPSLRNPS